MKPTEKKPETVFRIIGRESGESIGSYSRAYCDEYDFRSVHEARTANCHGIYKDKVEYKIAKYRVIYELIDDDVDPATPEEFEQAEIVEKKRAALEKEMDALGLTDMQRVFYPEDKIFLELVDSIINKPEEAT